MTAGSYTIQFQDSSGSYLGEWFDDAADQASAAVIDVAAGEAVVGVDASLARAGSIAGVVTDSAGAPLQGVYVYSAPGNGYAYTAADGSYRVGGLSAGSYQIRFYGSGTLLGEWFDDAAGQATAAVIDVAAGEAVVGVDASLSEGGSLTGTVSDAAGAPLQGVYITASNAAIGSARGAYTDSAGEYVFDQLAPGTYTVYFYGSGQNLGEWFDDSPTLAGAASVTVESGATTAGIDAELSSGTIGGVVTDPAGRPLASLRVRLSTGTTTLTDPAGRYRFDLLAAGDYTVLVEGGTAFASTYYDSSVTLEDATVISLAGGDQLLDVDIALSRKPAQISGLVVRQVSAVCAPPAPTIPETSTTSTALPSPVECSATTPTPMPGATVVARPDPSLNTYTRSTSTDANGRFRFEGLPTGEWTLYIRDSSQNLLPEYWDDQLSSGLATPIAVDETLDDTELLIQLADSGRISGTVTDIEGNGLTDVWVSAWNEAGAVVFSAYSDDDGSYELRGMDTGSYRVQFVSYGIHADEYFSDAASLEAASPISVTRGEITAGIDAQLDRLGQITGTVAGPDGEPAAGINVSATGPSSRSATTNDQGDYTITGLLDGDYTLRFRSLDQRYIDEYYDNALAVAEAIAVPAATATVTTGIDAALDRYGSIRGTVLDEAGQPASAVTVSVSRGTSLSTIRSVSTDVDGNFELLGLTTGSYKLNFTDASRRFVPRWLDGVVAWTDSPYLEVELGVATEAPTMTMTLGGTIAGGLTDALGAPLSGGASLSGCATTGSIATSFTFTGLEAGTYTVRGIASGYQCTSTTVTVDLGETIEDVAIALNRFGTITGVATDESGTPISGISVSRYTGILGSFMGSVTTNTSGRYTFTDVGAGDWTLSASDPNGRVSARMVRRRYTNEAPAHW